MAKKIFMSESDAKTLQENVQKKIIDFFEELKKRRFQKDIDKEIKFGIKIDEVKDDREAILLFSPKAWIKMFSLINNFTGEVEWHGTVERLDKNCFIVNDILIFPHTVTSTTVTSDQAEYEEWLNSLDDKTFNSLRFHGHSHVNMNVNPSGVDMEYRKNVLNNFSTPKKDTDYFYIFFIGNKNGQISSEIYDLQNNALYSSEEIDIRVLFDDDEDLDDFIEESKSVVKEIKYSSYGKSQPSSGYGKYYGSQGGCGGFAQPPRRDSKEDARQDTLTNSKGKTETKNNSWNYPGMYSDMYGGEWD